MKVIKQFEQYNLNCSEDNKPITVILLGGITEGDTWRSDVISQLRDLCYLDNQDSFMKDLWIFNPEDMDEAEAKSRNKDELLEGQILWDYHRMNWCNIKSVYLSDSSSQSLSMFELGYMLGKDYEDLIISIEPKFRRNEELKMYLKSIYCNKDIDINTFINDKATPTSHALAIYAKYKHLLANYYEK